ncbi:MAG: glycosyltransferase family 4 protein [Pseudomonadota bacterium]
MTGALFAVPGRLDLATGGYEYARRLLSILAPGETPCALTYWPLPDLGIAPQRDALEEAARRLAAGPFGWPVLIDGLALGVLPPEILASCHGPLAALVHHPLALEHGLSKADAARLAASERAALAEAHVVITTSKHTAETLVAEYDVPRARISVARPGIPRPGHQDGRIATPPKRPCAGPMLLSIGTLIPRKGYDLLLEALSQHTDLPWQLRVIGDPTRDPAHAAALRERVDKLGLADRVRFEGVKERADLADAYAEADLFVLASRHEGYGMAYAEAMAAGVPVVGCDAGAVAEATAGGAHLVPPGEVSHLADALRPLIATAEARAALAARGRAAARRLNDWDDTASSVAAALAPIMPVMHACSGRAAPLS